MKYIVYYETDYCDNFKEKTGSISVEALDIIDASKKAQKFIPRRTVIISLQEVKQ